MNKKYLNIGLLILFFFIWGAVFYKYFIPKTNNFQKGNSVVAQSSNYSYAIIKDTFKLELQDRDPFRVSITKQRSVIKKPLKKSTNQKVVPKKELVWPNIKYFGFVKGTQNKTKLTLIKVNNKFYRKREKEKINALTIVKAYSDSVIVKFDNKEKIIRK